MRDVIRVHPGYEGRVRSRRRPLQSGDQALGRLPEDEKSGIPLLEALGGPVGRPVVDEDQPPVAEGLAADRLRGAGERGPAVADRKPDVDARQKYLSGGIGKTS